MKAKLTPSLGTDDCNVPNILTSKSSPMRIRISLKLLLVIFTVIIILTTVSYWRKCEPSISVTSKQWHFKEPCKPNIRKPAYGIDIFQFDDKDDGYDGRSDTSQKLNFQNAQLSTDEIECFINDEYTIPCHQNDDEVYIPFSFLQKYFEIYGKIVKHGGVSRFEWQHSYSKVYFPRTKYDPSGVYLWFENYNVEVRDRVKCISGAEGVPVSTQWDTRGHFYPIQIAQFGLSHFSKNLTEVAYSHVLLEDGDFSFHGQWKIPNSRQKDVVLKKITDTSVGNTVLEFKCHSSGKEIEFIIEDRIEETILNCDLMLISNGSLTVVLSIPGDTVIYKIHYIMSDNLLSSSDTDIYYGIGKNIQWRYLARDILTDLNKALLSMQSKRKVSKTRSIHIHSITLRGFGRIDNISLSSSSHMAHFFASANWFVTHQDEKGGWPNMVTRKLSNGMLELSPGWYSAMAQGQAMSLLTRAFKITNDLHYLETALRALKLFSIRSENHGILTTFLGKYVWYEEYPTVPSSFVLNGFIYSLFGLYDVKESCTHEHCRLAGQLFEDGLVSLTKMLPLFDTGSGSVYDLRHYSLGIAPNLARWDYHSTHINQLLFLSTIHDNPILKSVSERWSTYMKGKRAPHN